MPGRIIDVDFRKWPDTRHWQFDTEYIAEDDHGIWIAGRAGSPAQKGWDPPKTFGHGFVKLIVPGAWWTALWNTHGGIWVYVDIIAPAIWHGDRVKLLDLDLDVIISADGTVTVEDEDEFAEHQVALGYPPEMISGAERATADVLRAIEQGAEPFATAGPSRLAEWIREP